MVSYDPLPSPSQATTTRAAEREGGICVHAGNQHSSFLTDKRGAWLTPKGGLRMRAMRSLIAAQTLLILG